MTNRAICDTLDKRRCATVTPQSSNHPRVLPMVKNARGGRTASVIDPFRAIAGTDGGALLWARQGTVCAEQGDQVGALRCFQRSIEIDLDCVEAWTGLSEVFNGMRDWRRAGACLDIVRRIRALSPGYAAQGRETACRPLS